MASSALWDVNPAVAETQTLNQVIRYNGKSGFTAGFQLHFNVAGSPSTSGPPASHVLSDVDQAYNPSLLSFKVVDCNFTQLNLKFSVEITQRDNFFLLSSVDKNIRGKALYSRTECSCSWIFIEGDIYWIRFVLPNLNLRLPIEIKFTIIEAVPTPPKSSKWIEDCLAEKPLCYELQTGLWKMYEEKRSTDASVVVKKKGELKTFNVHWVVMEVKSPVLAAMFAHECLEKATRKLQIVDFEVSAVEKFIEFLYRDVCDFQDVDDGLQLLALADKYDVQKLKMRCQAVLASNSMDVPNAATILQMADRHNADLLKETALRFVKDNYKEVASTPGWKDMNPELLNDVINFILNN